MKNEHAKQSLYLYSAILPQLGCLLDLRSLLLPLIVPYTYMPVKIAMIVEY